jgi:uncharacterized membrane-anchored protein YhcB (DUF1043 family)
VIVSAYCHDKGMNGALYLIIGLLIGFAVGLVIGAIRLNSEKGKVALLNSQIDVMREEENRLTTLNKPKKQSSSAPVLNLRCAPKSRT